MRILRLGWVAITLLAFAAPTRADECRYGDVKMLFESLQVVFGVQNYRGLDTRAIGQAYAPTGGPCQFRLWAGPAPGSDEAPPVQTFHSTQFFLGGSADNFDYPNYGLTLAQAKGDMELLGEHVYLMRVGDDWSYDLPTLLQHDQPLVVRPYRQEIFGDGGLTLSRQVGIIDKLAVGHYVALYNESYPGNPGLQKLYPDNADLFAPWDFWSVVFLDIVP